MNQRLALEKTPDNHSDYSKSNAKTKLFVTTLVLSIAIACLYILSRHNYPLFHSIVDMATVFIAAGVFVVVWTRRRLLDNHYYLFVGIAFLFFGFLDFLHLLGNKNMGVFPQYGNLGPTLYIASRYLLSISLVVAPLFIRRKLNASWMCAIYSVVTLLLILSIFYWQNFPATYIEGVGLTSFKVISDYIVCLILLGAIGLLWVQRRAFDPKVLRLIIYSLTFSIASGLAFTTYTDPFGVTNAVGHFFQIVSFFLVYSAFIETVMLKPQDILYRNLQQSKEEVTKLNSELETANKEMESFSYTVSHDLKAPLRHMDGFSRALFEDYADKLDEQGKDYLQKISSASQTMSALIDDILKLSRITRVPLEVQTLKLSEIAEQVASELRRSEPQRNVEFRITPGLIASGDRVLLKLVFDNLLGNAFKFTGKCSHAIIEFGFKSDKGVSIYFVKDNGAGFDMTYVDRLFQPFRRLHSEKDFPGTGIGLASVQRVISRHHGRVWVEGEVGKGATFYFTLD
jgi:signal transduction histidine kinase